MNTHNSIVQKSPEVKATLMTINRSIDKQNVEYLYDALLFRNEMRLSTEIHYNMDTF